MKALRFVFFVIFILVWPAYFLSQAPPGIKNVGNTCYQDSVYQLLYNLPTVRDFMIHVAPPKDTFALRKNSIGAIVHTLFIELSKLEPKQLFIPQDVCPQAIQALPGLELKKGEAADAALFLTSLLQQMVFNDVVVKEGVRALRFGYPFHGILDHALTRTFMIGLRVEKQCNACGARVVTYENRVASPNFVLGPQDLLRPREEKELSFYKCGICRQDKGGVNRTFQVTLPQVLLFNRSGGKSIQEYLKPQPFSRSLSYSFGSSDNCQYDLVGILLYNGGHFQALVRPGLFEGSWYLCNGAAVDAVGDQEVREFAKLGVWRGGDYPRTLLYYRKCALKNKAYSRDELLRQLQTYGIDTKEVEDWCDRQKCTVDALVRGVEQGFFQVEQFVRDNFHDKNVMRELERLYGQLNILKSVVG